MSAIVMSLDDFRGVLEDVLDESGLDIKPETTAKDVEKWDSLNHVRVLVRIEQAYGIEFPVDEIESAQNVGELISLVNRLLCQKTA